MLQPLWINLKMYGEMLSQGPGYLKADILLLTAMTLSLNIGGLVTAIGKTVDLGIRDGEGMLWVCMNG